MAMLFLSIGTIMGGLFVYFLFKGNSYDYMFEPLYDGDFPLKFTYSAGMAMQMLKPFMMPEELGKRLRNQCRIIYGAQYSEYYARAYWSQALSLGVLFGSVCFLLAGVFPEMSAIMGMLGLVMTVMPGAYFINHLQELVTNRGETCEKALPNAISKLALMVNSGVILHEAWSLVAFGNEGVFYELMRKSCEDMRNGISEMDAIIDFGNASNSESVKKFTSMLAQSIERGGGDLPIFLRNQSKELWEHHRQFMLQQGEKAAGKLLMPIALMFGGIMMIVVVAAMQSMSL